MEEIKCAYCGSTIDAEEEFCPCCQAPVKESLVEAAVAESTREPEPKSSNTASMVLGIISSACCWYPFVSIAGIVLGAIAVSKVKKFKLENGELDGKGKAAKATGLVGLIGGICMTLIWAVLFIMFIATAVAYSGNFD